MIEAVSLPAGFEALAPYAGTWGKLEDQAERYLFRQQSSMKDLKAFYDATAPRLKEIFDHLDKFPMDRLPASEALLYRTALGLTEAAMAIEVFDQPGVPYAPFPHHMAIEWNEYK
ncbi:MULTISPECIES: hypothetical protein [Sphingobium]|uniref:Uncharacterized protein n=1 Tax=Sphingobium baderi TaxID=1332080 RepID=A0A0S3EXQ9_9SPHN|nr:MULTISPECIES: hypothetical protein [Sphingobium]ALR20230.1 hypothetical protein ATN00_07850 [Sphingobium baderi]